MKDSKLATESVCKLWYFPQGVLLSTAQAFAFGPFPFVLFWNIKDGNLWNFNFITFGNQVIFYLFSCSK